MAKQRNKKAEKARKAQQLAKNRNKNKNKAEGEMPALKDDDAMYIIPGSQTTIAQLGVPETKSPPKLYFKSRMFPGQVANTWEPYKVLERVVTKPVQHGEPKAEDDAVMGGTTEAESLETEYYEDLETDEGAVWPIVEGRIVNWSCFFALLTHVYNTLSPTLKAGIVMVTEPAWTHGYREKICQFIFEKFKPPGLYLLDAASAAACAFQIGEEAEGAARCCVVDVGYDKCDVTAWNQSEIVHVGRLISIPNCGGNTMTKNLLRLLGPKGFTYDMCEQLKRSNICEILPPITPLPTEVKVMSDKNPAATASTGVNAPPSKPVDSQSGLPRGPGLGTETGEDKVEDSEGVLDVASIVASGKASEILAKKEKEKAEKAAKKSKAGAANDAKQIKLANSQKPKATFHYTEPRAFQGVNGIGQSTNGEAGPSTALAGGEGVQVEEPHRTESISAILRKEVEVGIERFQADGEDHDMLYSIAACIHLCIQQAPPEVRSGMWDNIVIVGNGSKVRGFKESLLALLNNKYLISTQSGTIFTSELPSDFSTPIPTGANTPNPHGPNVNNLGHHAPGVNPLLVAATHASNPSLAPPGQQQYQQFGMARSSHTRYNQTPTSIKLTPPHDYLPEWKEHGFEEGAYYGVIMHAHGVFTWDQAGGEKAYMSRVNYNEEGPSAIHRFFY